MRRRPFVRTTVIVLALGAVGAAGAVAATGVLGTGSGSTSSATASTPSSTAEVKQTTLTRTETVDGSLGYGGTTPVQVAGQAAGTLTWLPAAGQVLTRGEPVYSVDAKKVPLLYGATPLYRTLTVGSEGPDVTMLEQNLSALGYTGFTVDHEYTARTATAVRAWQEALGRKETGTIAPGEVVVASGPKRVAVVNGILGTPAGGAVLTWTGTGRVVTVELETQYEDLIKVGAKAIVELPDGTEVEAVVASIGTTATAKSGASGDSSTVTLPVTLTVADQKKLGRYQAAPVNVTVAAESRRNILAVPVNALVAREGGGYAVQAVTGSGVEYKPVKLGMFADGLVEISGAGITKGLKVGIPE
ncbi:peptidoglycan-binding protein [Kribbella hippodromi]|uniref:Peptidoglycan-binding protein n=1 Tax=Kribbella hippodromi TaxID=434347 RepID=A0ABP4P1D6_9ACTN